MPTTPAHREKVSRKHDDLKHRLSRYRELTITVTGRKSGRAISNPVWFVLEGDTLYLLPVEGSDTQWYKNVLKDPKMRIDARGPGSAARPTLASGGAGAEKELRAVPITDTKRVASVAEQFRRKYGASDVKKYYSKFDVAVELAMP
jgi:deazaflavin-dependent oxidoreductase (nitroreductase family)